MDSLARVASVKSDTPGSGVYRVTMRGTKNGDVYWLSTDSPPRTGDLVDLLGAETRKVEVTGLDAAAYMIEGGELFIIDEPYPRRIVAPAWLDLARRSVRRALYGYQVEGAGWLAERAAQGLGSILADEPGTGKTIQSIAALCAVGAFPALIVCPSSLRTNWLREFLLAVPKLTMVVPTGRTESCPRSVDVVIQNYDNIAARESELATYGFKSLVLDECHLVKEPRAYSTHRAAVATRLARGIKCRILLTGTPILNRIQDAWRILHIADPRAWKSFELFKQSYCKIGKGRPTSEHRLRVQEFRVMADAVLLRRTREQVLQDLPSKSRRIVAVDLEPVDREHYDAAEKNVVQWLKTAGASSRAMSAVHNEALVRIGILRRIAAVGKLRWALPRFMASWFASRLAQPLVIFAYHVAVQRGVARICEKLRIPYSQIRAADGPAERDKAVTDFQTKRTWVFLAPIKCAGLGLNLQVSSDVVVLERTWTPAEMLQCEGRVERIGQTRPITITYFDAVGTVDEHIAEIIESKRQAIGELVDGSPEPEESVAQKLAEWLLAKR